MTLIPIKKSDADLQRFMAEHYSQPKGFVGRQLFYKIVHDDKCYGCIAFGSATRHLPNRQIIGTLNNGLNNIFYHVEKVNGEYPFRNFTVKVLKEAEKLAVVDYFQKYGDVVNWLETLVELPRTGEIYKRAGYTLVGTTKGYTCKRVAGKGTDSWSGKRVWDEVNLRPKLVFVKGCI